MDFSRTEAQHDLAGLTRRILIDRCTSERLHEIESGGSRFDSTLWTALAESGVLAAALPKSADGGGFGLLEQCSVLIESGRAVAPVPYLPSIVMAASALAEFGTSEQCNAWAAPAAAGQVVLTAALAEEGSDLLTPCLRAGRVEGQWVLNGTKTTVPAGPIADLFLVSAMSDNRPVVLLVTADDEGVSVRPQHIVDGDTEAELDLEDVRLGDDRMLGEAEVLRFLVARGTIGVCAAQLGVVERALEMTAQYAGERVQFGRAIGSFQAVAQRLADAYIDVEAVRLTMWQAAWREAEDLDGDAEIATAKYWAAEAGHRVAHTAVHIHGGVGIDLDHPLHRYFVAAKRNEFTLGAATTQLRRLGATLAS